MAAGCGCSSGSFEFGSFAAEPAVMLIVAVFLPDGCSRFSPQSGQNLAVTSDRCPLLHAFFSFCPHVEHTTEVSSDTLT
jgi:hypothetical protein